MGNIKFDQPSVGDVDSGMDALAITNKGSGNALRANSGGNDIAPTGLGNTSIDSVDQIAMRINEGEALAALKILERHRFNER